MPPEIWKGKPYDLKCDVWSLGTLLFQLMTFTIPFMPKRRTKTLELDLMTAILYHPCPSLPAHFSAELRQIVWTCLLKDPSRRPTVLELL
mmetsp:Transcript_5627/g.7500  ORF Transcript_5627/g.7500 Transcript_5627/m.7500 type:complete len:90 (+) Transcript_5627:601-870(+)